MKSVRHRQVSMKKQSADNVSHEVEKSLIKTEESKKQRKETIDKHMIEI